MDWPSIAMVTTTLGLHPPDDGYRELRPALPITTMAVTMVVRLPSVSGE